MSKNVRRYLTDNLLLRSLTTLLLLPIVLWAIWRGGLAFYSLLILTGALMVKEWVYITRAVSASYSAFILGLVVVAAVIVDILGIMSGISVLALALVITLLSGIILREPIWILPLGTAYILTPLLVALWLRADASALALFYLLLVVMATDTFAMLVGRWLGRTRLAPKCSPRKTWEGLAGGMIAAGLAGGMFAWWQGLSVMFLIAMSVVLALCAQGGDLLESALKRRAGLDQSGNILPGHGGVLDRLDGLVAVLVVAAILIWIRGGLTLGPTDALLAW